jgi:hypothetical protein
MLLVCCFCDQIRDESMGHGHWREQLYGSMGSRTPKRERPFYRTPVVTIA